MSEPRIPDMATKGWRRLGYLVALLAALGYGTGWVFVKWVYSLGVGPMQQLSVRYLLAIPLAWALLFALQRGKLQVSRRSLPALAGVGLFIAATETFLSLALARLDASLVSVLFYTYPVFVSVAAVIVFSESLNRFRAASLMLIVFGSVLVAQLNPFGALRVDGLGLVLTFLGALSAGSFALLAQSIGDKNGPFTMGAFSLTVAAVPLMASSPPTFLFDGSLSGEALLALALLSVFCTVMPVFSFVAAVRMVGASNAAIAVSLEPVVAVVSAFFILGERMALLQILGMSGIIAAVVLLQFQPRKSPQLAGSNAPVE
ncbi:MAG: DMT family transporter [Chloroflexi bacterium]|nr:DMT family transporter [Chloroflexota bacterium]